MVKFITLIFAGFLFLANPESASAGVSCQPIYGGGQTCVNTNNIIIDKKILNPQTNQLIDNLGIKDPRYYPEFIVNFRLAVTNTSRSTINNITVKDIFPQYVVFSSGPGTFTENTKTLSFNIESLKPEETKTFIVTGRIAKIDQISTDRGAVVCVVNQANVTSENNFSQDNSQFCIEKSPAQQAPAVKGGFPVLSPSPIQTTPATGPSDFQLAGIAIIGILGYLLRRKSKNL